MLWFVCFFNYADRQSIFSVFPKLRQEFGFSPVQLGLIGSAFMWVYAAGAPLAGLIADRVRRKDLWDWATARGMRDRLESGLLELLPGAVVNGAGAERLPGTLSITVPGTDAEALLMALDLEGICASAGSACHSGSSRPSSVLSAMGLTAAEARATLRLAAGP